MNAILSEAIESYRFNNDLLDAIINDIPMSPAMEEAGQTGTPSSTTTTTTSTTAPNTTDNKNEAKPAASGEAKEKKDFNLIEKIKKIFQFLQVTIPPIVMSLLANAVICSFSSSKWVVHTCSRMTEYSSRGCAER